MWYTRNQNFVCLTCSPCEAKTRIRHNAESDNSSEKHVRAIYTPLNPTFICGKIGVLRGIPIFLILLQNIDCGYSLEPLGERGGSNECPQSMF